MDTKKLTEEELNEVTPATAQPVPATAEEVSAATPAEVEPAPAESVDVVATPQVAAKESPAADPLTPPVEGMVPTGWAYPDDLAAAIAMATGDVEAAETAGDAVTTEEPLVTETPAEGVEPAEVAPAAAPAAPQTEGELTMEERQLVMEFRKKKLQESGGLPEVTEDLITDAPEGEIEEDPAEEGWNSEVAEDALADDIEEEIDIDEILASFDSIFSDLDGEEETCEEGECEDVIDSEVEDAEEPSVEETSDAEEVADTLEDLADLLRVFDGDDVAEEVAVDAHVTEDGIEDAFDFLAALEGDLFEDDLEEEISDEDISEETPVIEENPAEEGEEAHEMISAIKEANGIKYPAGSAPKESAIVSGVPAEEAVEPVDEDLVRSYEEKSRARREAFLNFREELIQKRKSGSKFGEALNANLSNTPSSENKDAWSNNTFMSKYNESKKLNWAELFEKGILG